MNNEDEVKEFFAKVNDVLDNTHSSVFAAVDMAFVHIDRFVGEWEKRSVEAARGTGEEVKVEPDVETMRQDIANSRKKNNPLYNTTHWLHASDEVVKFYWNTLPDEDKSWVKRNNESPL